MQFKIPDLKVRQVREQSCAVVDVRVDLPSGEWLVIHGIEIRQSGDGTPRVYMPKIRRRDDRTGGWMYYGSVSLSNGTWGEMREQILRQYESAIKQPRKVERS